MTTRKSGPFGGRPLELGHTGNLSMAHAQWVWQAYAAGRRDAARELLEVLAADAETRRLAMALLLPGEARRQGGDR